VVEGYFSSQVRYNAFGEIIAKDSRTDTGLEHPRLRRAVPVYDEHGNMVASNAEGVACCATYTPRSWRPGID
jgi:hypothetical protein